jgi:putative heme-binding domain-containing protein
LAARQQSRSDTLGVAGNPSDPAGQKIFAASCASCHGLDGRGGERAPGIAANARLQRMPDADIAAIISHGIPDTGMPAFRALAPDQVQAVVGYVRFLQGQNKAQPLPGDPVRGKAVFLGKGECSSCHMVRGEGGFLGPDLSTYGASRSAKDVADAITNPRRISDPAYRTAVATTRDGHRLTGIVRNEDNFSVQLQTADGAFHFLSRSTLQKLEYQDHPLMPTNYGDRLDRAELDDLASYLISVGRSAKPDANSQDEDLREDDFKD